MRRSIRWRRHLLTCTFRNSRWLSRQTWLVARNRRHAGSVRRAADGEAVVVMANLAIDLHIHRVGQGMDGRMVHGLPAQPTARDGGCRLPKPITMRTSAQPFNTLKTRNGRYLGLTALKVPRLLRRRPAWSSRPTAPGRWSRQRTEHSHQPARSGTRPDGGWKAPTRGN